MKTIDHTIERLSTEGVDGLAKKDVVRLTLSGIPEGDSSSYMVVKEKKHVPYNGKGGFVPGLCLVHRDNDGIMYEIEVPLEKIQAEDRTIGVLSADYSDVKKTPVSTLNPDHWYDSQLLYRAGIR